MRVVQRSDGRGSLKWIQRAVNHRPDVLDAPLLARLGGAAAIEWVSPLESDDYAEYRDAGFLRRVGAGDLVMRLDEFWPRRGPQWDALGVSNAGDILLVEAKANLPELNSPGTAAGEMSRARINAALANTAKALACEQKSPWSSTYFQLANRLAHLWFLRAHGYPAWLVLVNFVGDADVGGPHTAAEWEAAYQDAEREMGLSAIHALSPYIVHLYPHVSELTEAVKASV